MTTATATAGTTAVATAAPLYVTGAGVVSAVGYGLAPLGELLLGQGEPERSPVGADADAYPPRPVRAVHGFDVKTHLGRKGTKYLDRLTSFGLVACKEVLEGAEVSGGRTGVVLATNTGSVSTHSSLLYDTLTLEKPYLVNPGQFPNTVMNSTSGQIAIRNGLRGLNATVAAWPDRLAARVPARTPRARPRPRRTAPRRRRGGTERPGGLGVAPHRGAPRRRGAR